MTTYAAVCIDKRNAQELRLEHREAHLAYARRNLDILKLGGPFLDEDGAMTGSLLIVEVDSLEAAQAFVDGDPYVQAGLFERVEVRPWRPLLGKIS
ncbi:YciI family protein [Tsuneonella troitsensis]|uniref:YciI family protein n=1 Tax=Tsuneonella troitsensis TaxID=292222 RepID=UPI00070FCF76|nr:YciI family protein [Tsuneonella troitsensis]